MGKTSIDEVGWIRVRKAIEMRLSSIDLFLYLEVCGGFHKDRTQKIVGAGLAENFALTAI
ncbi:MAG: hypothetical protein SWY16_10415 [Cyanobacteriota bacterium]|nr:hypothetical protein [Cyanobacteriota bacterium]